MKKTAKGLHLKTYIETRNVEQIAEKRRMEAKEKATKGAKEEEKIGYRKKHGTKLVKNNRAQ